MKKIIYFINTFVFLFFSTLSVAKINHQAPLRVILDWYVNPNHAPLFVTKAKGYFEEAGIKVVFIPPADPADGPKLVAAHQADLAITYQPTLMFQIERGLPLVRVGTLVNQPLSCLVALRDGPIKEMSDLRGKNIGYSSDALSSAVLQTMLKNSGVSKEDVQFINVRYALTQALLTHRIDAFTGAMRNFEVIQLSLNGHPARVFYPEEHGFPAYDELIFVTSRDEINDPRLIKFMEALKKGVSYLKEHPQKSWLRFAHDHPELNNELNRRAWFASINYFDSDPAMLNRQKYHDLARFMYQHHLIKEMVPVNNYAIELS